MLQSKPLDLLDEPELLEEELDEELEDDGVDEELELVEEELEDVLLADELLEPLSLHTDFAPTGAVVVYVPGVPLVLFVW